MGRPPDRASILSPMQMVRVHAILVNAQPALVEPAAQQLVPSPPVQQLREAALQLLAGALGGDVLAAEYLLLLSLERVTTR